MKTLIRRTLLVLSCGLAAACAACSGAAAVAPTPTELPTLTALLPTATPAPTQTASPTAAPSATPLPGLLPSGPTNFPAGYNPLTGLPAPQPELLQRRPLVIKVQNLPRDSRPQWGLTRADLVYEYYTEMGTTRFSAVFYSQNAEKVGPVRSGRFFDANVVRMYKAVLVFGSAFDQVYDEFTRSEFANRLVLEVPGSCPALCRSDPNGQNYLMANTAELEKYIQTLKMENAPQDLTGMRFDPAVPANGQAAQQVFVRYSGAIYNRWDYDPQSKRYLRFADAQDDLDRTKPVYQPLTDRLTGQPVAADTLVMLLVPHRFLVQTSQTEVVQMDLNSVGTAYAARDGQLYRLRWFRNGPSAVLTLVNDDNTPFAFKPGQTWFEVLGAASTADDPQTGVWQFNFVTP